MTHGDNADGLTVVVTGAATPLGAEVVRELEGDPRIGRIIGLAHRPPRAAPAGLDLRLGDVRDPDLGRLIGRPDAVVHLGTVPPGADDATRLDIMTRGTRNLLGAAVDAGARVFVQMSTAMVYGAQPTNSIPLSEEAAVAAEPAFPTAYHAVLAERIVQDAARHHPGLRVVVLRPAPVLGQNDESPLLRHLESPLLMLVRDHDPPLQLCATGDLARAVHASIDPGSTMAGAYNVAADGWLTAREVSRLLGRPRLHLPEALALASADVLAELGLLDAGAAWVRYLMHPWIVDTRRLKAHGWAASASNRDLVRAFVAERHDVWRFGPLRVSRRRLALTAGATAALGGVTVAGAGWYAWRRWGRGRG